MDGLTEAVRELDAAVRRVLELAGQPGGLVAGSLYASRTRCGRRACKCMASDYRHESLCVSFTQEGHSRTRTVAEAAAGGIRAGTAAFREARVLRRKAARIVACLLRSLDGTIAGAAEKGQKEMLVALTETRKGGK